MATAELEAPATVTVKSRRGEPAWEVALLFPSQGSWSEEDFLALDSNRMMELSDGCVEFLTMPTWSHQLLVEFLYQLFSGFVATRGLGKVMFAPVPIRLWAGKYREPDIFFLTTERLRTIDRYPQGADLVIEVVSEGDENRDRDLVKKPQDYARAGISEYWIVDPKDRRVRVLALDGDAYRVHGEFTPGQTATSVLLMGLTVDVAQLFAAAEVKA